MSENRVIIGLDLSYSINKKSYNIINASSFNDFCISKLNISGGVKSVHKLTSFGSDRYGIIYKSDKSDKSDKSVESESNKSEKDKEISIESYDRVTGFIFNKNEYNALNESVSKALNKIKNINGLVFSNTASGTEIVIFDNTKSQFKTIDLFDKKEKEQIRKENNYKSQIQEVDVDVDVEVDVEVEEEVEAEDEKEQGMTEEKEQQMLEQQEQEMVDEKKKESNIKREKRGGAAVKKVKNLKKLKTVGTNTPKFKVKSSIREVYKHLLLTANGSLYGLHKSFHKKYVNNQRVISVRCDGNRCTLCLDENGVLWSFGINLFGKLGLKRNDKKQIYTNPREISIFKAYKVYDFGITNRCCIAVCANGSIYGWGSYYTYSKKEKKTSVANIWYTPNLITANDDEITSYDSYYSYDQIRKKQQYKVYAGYRFILLLNITTNKLYVINTEFGFTLIQKPKNGLIIQTQEIKLTHNLLIKHVIPSNESAIIIANQTQ